MLSIQNRLSLKTDRLRIEKDGQKKITHNFTFIFSTRVDPTSPSRYAVLTSKQTFGKSVIRNSVRRMITEIIRRNLDLMSSGIDVILIPKRNIISSTPLEILEQLKSI